MKEIRTYVGEIFEKIFDAVVVDVASALGVGRHVELSGRQQVEGVLFVEERRQHQSSVRTVGLDSGADVVLVDGQDQVAGLVVERDDERMAGRLARLAVEGVAPRAALPDANAAAGARIGGAVAHRELDAGRSGQSVDAELAGRADDAFGRAHRSVLVEREVGAALGHLTVAALGHIVRHVEAPRPRTGPIHRLLPAQRVDHGWPLAGLLDKHSMLR